MSKARETGDAVLFAMVIVAFGIWYYFFYQGNGSMLNQLAQAIYDFEDPNKNAVATRNNNPGNLKPPDGSGTYWSGQTAVDNSGFAVFDSLSSGLTALINDLKTKATSHPTWSLQDLFNRWLGGAVNSSGGVDAPPSSEGNAITYAATVARQIGVSVSTTLGDIVRSFTS